MTELATDKM